VAAGIVLKRVYLSLGSNLGDREGMLREAIQRLHRPDLRVTRVSRVYETAPVDVRAQPDFLNIVLEAETSLFPMRLLHRVAGIEREMGRRRLSFKGPRTIDIDILLFGPFVVGTPTLHVPHPRMAERRFVLQPLAELAPDLRHPVTRRTVRDMLAAAPAQTVRRTAIHLEPPSRDEH
jgi:2-amino-4-hydroxy-6-hydroxymethyldihydropteridine diphosphokinase